MSLALAATGWRASQPESLCLADRRSRSPADSCAPRAGSRAFSASAGQSAGLRQYNGYDVRAKSDSIALACALALLASDDGLALLYTHQGRYAAAEPLYGRALAIREKALGPGHPDVARSLNNLGDLYRLQACYADALPLVQTTRWQPSPFRCFSRRRATA
jgi:tetratricopeptide (TPR) repeat protein